MDPQTQFYSAFFFHWQWISCAAYALILATRRIRSPRLPGPNLHQHVPLQVAAIVVAQFACLWNLRIQDTQLLLLLVRAVVVTLCCAQSTCGYYTPFKWAALVMLPLSSCWPTARPFLLALLDAWILCSHISGMLEWRHLRCARQLVSQLTYHWVYDYLRSLSSANNSSILPALPPSLQPAITLKRFNCHWQHEIATGRRSLGCALMHTFSRQLAACSVLRLLVLFRDVGQPMVVAQIIHALGQPPQQLSAAWCAYVLLLYVAVSFGAAIIEQNHIDLRDQIKLAIHTSLCGAVHQVHAHPGCSTEQLKAIAAGHGTDLYSCGIRSTEELADHFVRLFDSIWVPLRLAAGIYVFYCQLGWVVIPGTVVALVYLPIRMYLLRKTAAAQSSISAASSRRISLVAHYVENVVSIRLLGWCNTLARRIRQLRNTDELQPTIAASTISLLRVYMWAVCRTGGPLVSLFIYSTVAQRMHFSAKSSTLTTEQVYLAHTGLRELFPLLIDVPHAFDSWWTARHSYNQVKALLVQSRVRPASSAELESEDKPHLAVSIANTTFSWPVNNGRPVFTLANVNMCARKGQLVAITGKVGAGKSSLLAAVLGEMPGSTHPAVAGRVAYVSQTPWIMGGSIRDNITLGLPYDASWFQSVTAMCQLAHDLVRWPLGEHTVVGANGLALSGGQRMRIALARAVYSRASVYLLDDILATVDAHVAQKLLETVLLGSHAVLRTATRIVVTRHRTIVHAADLVYTVANGQVLAAKRLPATVNSLEHYSATCVTAPAQPATCSDDLTETDNLSDGSTAVDDTLVLPAQQPCNLNVLDPVWYVLRLCGRIGVVGFLATVITQCLVSHQAQLWLSKPIPSSQSSASNTAFRHFAYCAAWWIADLTLELVASWWTSVAWKRAIFTQSHDQLLSQIAQKPLRWVLTTPTGRILSLFTHSQHAIDSTLPTQLASTTIFVIKMAFETWIIATFHPLLVAAVLAIIAVMWHVVCVSRQPLERFIAMLTDAQPLIDEQYQESSSGTVTIRAFKAGNFMQQQLTNRLARYAQLKRLCDSIETWIDLSMTILRESAISVAFAIALTSAKYPSLWFRVDPASTALVQTSVTMLLARLHHTVRHTHLLKTALSKSVEYIREVQCKPQTPPRHATVSGDWLTAGSIVFDNVSASYTADYVVDTKNKFLKPPLALRNVSFTIAAGQHMGIVGRTGAGKTSIVMTLLGLLLPISGQISIDGTDIANISPALLHSRLGVVPQSTFVLSGTVRDNLDPDGSCPDVEILNVLAIVGLSSVNLNSTNIDAWSVGQKQILGLARALLKRPRILILDEAVASVDSQLSRRLCAAIRNYCSRCTVITIAHHLDSVLGCDKILVIRDGAVCESGTPAELLACSDSAFSRMLRASQ